MPPGIHTMPLRGGRPGGKSDEATALAYPPADELDDSGVAHMQPSSLFGRPLLAANRLAAALATWGYGVLSASRPCSAAGVRRCGCVSEIQEDTDPTLI